MENLAGLAAFGFWMFLAAIIVASIWSDSRKREAQQETLRRIVESGQQLDPELVDRLLASKDGDGDKPDRDLKVAGVITMSVGPGLVAFGAFLAPYNDKILGVMIGVGALVLIIGMGLYLAGILSKRWQQED